MSDSADRVFLASGGVSRRFLAGAVAAGLLVGAAAANAQDMSRGVYANGTTTDSSGAVSVAPLVHFFEVGTDASHKTVTHRDGTVNTGTWTWMENTKDALSTSIAACAPTGFVQRNMNAAVFGSSLYLAFVGWKNCDKTTGGTVFVISYDMSANTFGTLIPLGPTLHKGIAASGPSATNDAATAAITTFNDKLYVFSDSAVYTSGDGVNWTTASVFSTHVPSGSQPLDAIAYYPPGVDPRILVVFGSGNSKSFYNWNVAYTYSWNGETEATAVDIREVPTFSNLLSPTEDVAAVGLVAGTATPANAPGFTVGAPQPAIQAIVFGYQAVTGGASAHIHRYEFTYASAATEAWMDRGKAVSDYTRVFNWFTDEGCNSNDHVLRQHVLAQYTASASGAQSAYSFTSDAMVPQGDKTNISCTTAGGTVTNTEDLGGDFAAQTLQGYWTLIGVVAGSPPFALNHASEGAQIAEVSNVKYGLDDSSAVSHSVDHENTVLQSSSAQVKIGLKRLDLEPQYSQSYSHAWLSKHEKTTTTTSSTSHEAGTLTYESDQSGIGESGWAVFSVPSFNVQDYALFAYDYDLTSGSGTPLNQDVHSMQVAGQSAVVWVPFPLANPGSAATVPPGIMNGVAPFPNSVDFRNGEWDAGYMGASNYTVKWGDGSGHWPVVNVLDATESSATTDLISVDQDNVVSNGGTNGVSLDVGMELEAETHLKGLELETTAELSAGYEGSFSQSTTTTTKTGKNVEAQLQLPNCDSSVKDCINTLWVQPFWLQATDSSAPWVPTGRSQLPWLLTWQVTYWQDNAGNKGGSSIDSDAASASVVGGTGGGTASASASAGSFSVAGGKMIWKGRKGSLEPIPMTAAKFVPALGASVTINGYRWSSWMHEGTWTRDHKVWTFRSPKGAASEAVLLKLDFGQLTWDLTLSKADLSPWIKAGDSAVHVGLAVNSKYSFGVDLVADVESAWDVKVGEVPGNPLSRWLASCRGSYDPAKGNGEVVVAGRIPEGRSTFGDLSFSVNGHQVDAPLIAHPDYADALAGKRPLVYEREGLHLTVDFVARTWSARVDGKGFHPGMVPGNGSVKLAAKLGGVLQHRIEVPVKNYTSKLTYRRWK